MIIVQKEVEYINILTDDNIDSCPFDGCQCEVYFDIYNEGNSTIVDSNVDINKLKYRGKFNNSIILENDPILGEMFEYDGQDLELSENTSINVINDIQYDVVLSHTLSHLKSGDLLVFTEVLNNKVTRIDVVEKNNSILNSPTSVFIEDESCKVDIKNDLWHIVFNNIEKGVKEKIKKEVDITVHFGGVIAPIDSIFEFDFSGSVIRQISVIKENQYTTKENPFLNLTGITNIDSDDISKIGYYIQGTSGGSVAVPTGVMIINDLDITRELSLQVKPIYDGLVYDTDFSLNFIHWGYFKSLPEEADFVLRFTDDVLFIEDGNNDIGEVSAKILLPDGTTENNLNKVGKNFVVNDSVLGEPGIHKVILTLSHTDGYITTAESILNVNKTDDIDTDHNEKTGAKYYFKFIINKKEVK